MDNWTDKQKAMYYIGKALEADPDFAQEWQNTMMLVFMEAWSVCGIKTKKEQDLKECIKIRCGAMLDNFKKFKDYLVQEKMEV